MHFFSFYTSALSGVVDFHALLQPLIATAGSCCCDFTEHIHIAIFLKESYYNNDVYLFTRTGEALHFGSLKGLEISTFFRMR